MRSAHAALGRAQVVRLCSRSWVLHCISSHSWQRQMRSRPTQLHTRSRVRTTSRSDSREGVLPQRLYELHVAVQALLHRRDHLRQELHASASGHQNKYSHGQTPLRDEHSSLSSRNATRRAVPSPESRCVDQQLLLKKNLGARGQGAKQLHYCTPPCYPSCAQALLCRRKAFEAALARRSARRLPSAPRHLLTAAPPRPTIAHEHLFRRAISRKGLHSTRTGFVAPSLCLQRD